MPSSTASGELGPQQPCLVGVGVGVVVIVIVTCGETAATPRANCLVAVNPFERHLLAFAAERQHRREQKVRPRVERSSHDDDLRGRHRAGFVALWRCGLADVDALVEGAIARPCRPVFSGTGVLIMSGCPGIAANGGIDAILNYYT